MSTHCYTPETDTVLFANCNWKNNFFKSQLQRYMRSNLIIRNFLKSLVIQIFSGEIRGGDRREGADFCGFAAGWRTRGRDTATPWPRRCLLRATFLHGPVCRGQQGGARLR